MSVLHSGRQRVGGRPAALILVALVAAAALVSGPTLLSNSARAETAPDAAPTWSVQPGGPSGPDGRLTFDYTAPAGSSISDVVSIINHSEFPATFALYPADGINNPENGSFTLGDGPESNTDLGSWITFAADVSHSPCNAVPLPAGCPPMPPGTTAVTLEAGSGVEIPITVQIPADARPGDHAAGLVASWYTISEGGDGQPLTLEQRVGSRMYLRVTGDLTREARVSGLTATFAPGLNPFAGDVTVSYLLDNAGNTRIHANQAITLTGPFGITYATFEPERVEHLVPGQRSVVTHTFSGVPPLLFATANVVIVPEAADGDQALPDTVHQDAVAWTMPWLLLLIVALAGGTIWVVLWRRRTYHNRLALTIEHARAEAAAAARQAGDAAPTTRQAPRVDTSRVDTPRQASDVDTPRQPPSAESAPSSPHSDEPTIPHPSEETP